MFLHLLFFEDCCGPFWSIRATPLALTADPRLWHQAENHIGTNEIDIEAMKPRHLDAMSYVCFAVAKDIITGMIPWIGGKQALCRAIISRFPADFRQRTYVEVFGGGASVLLNKERSVKEIYNDFNSNLVNLFRAVRDSPSELQAALRYILNAREDFDTVKARLARGHNKDPVLWARDFYQLIRQSYGVRGVK